MGYWKGHSLKPYSFFSTSDSPFATLAIAETAAQSVSIELHAGDLWSDAVLVALAIADDKHRIAAARRLAKRFDTELSGTELESGPAIIFDAFAQARDPMTVSPRVPAGARVQFVDGSLLYPVVRDVSGSGRSGVKPARRPPRIPPGVPEWARTPWNWSFPLLFAAYLPWKIRKLARLEEGAGLVSLDDDWARDREQGEALSGHDIIPSLQSPDPPTCLLCGAVRVATDPFDPWLYDRFCEGSWVPRNVVGIKADVLRQRIKRLRDRQRAAIADALPAYLSVYSAFEAIQGFRPGHEFQKALPRIPA